MVWGHTFYALKYVQVGFMAKGGPHLGACSMWTWEERGSYRGWLERLVNWIKSVTAPFWSPASSPMLFQLHPSTIQLSREPTCILDSEGICLCVLQFCLFLPHACWSSLVRLLKNYNSCVFSENRLPLILLVLKFASPEFTSPLQLLYFPPPL